MCQGWMAIKAARAAQSGKALAEVADLVRRMIPVTRMIQTADTLKYLYMSGRIGRAQHLAGSLLNIKPLISVEDGVIVALCQARSRKRSYEAMAELVKGAVGSNGKFKIACMHAAAREEVDKIQKLINSRVTVVESLVTEPSPALGVHSGPGTARLCFLPVCVID